MIRWRVRDVIERVARHRDDMRLAKFERICRNAQKPAVLPIKIRFHRECARRGSNAQPTAPEAVVLSS